MENIKKLMLGIAACNGLINRWRPQEEISDLVDSSLGNYPQGDLLALDAWLGSLTEDELTVLEDGEEEEMAAIVADSPTNEGGVCMGQLIEQIWDEID